MCECENGLGGGSGREVLDPGLCPPYVCSYASSYAIVSVLCAELWRC